MRGSIEGSFRGNQIFGTCRKCTSSATKLPSLVCGWGLGGACLGICVCLCMYVCLCACLTYEQDQLLQSLQAMNTVTDITYRIYWTGRLDTQESDSRRIPNKESSKTSFFLLKLKLEGKKVAQTTHIKLALSSMASILLRLEEPSLQCRTHINDGQEKQS